DLDADSGWLADNDSAQRYGQWLWFFDADNRLQNVMTADGRFLLDAATAKQLANYRVEPLRVDRPTDRAAYAIATLGRNRYCGCDAQGAGLLLSDGSVQLHDDWNDIEARSIGNQDNQGDGGWPIAQQRYVFTTDDGVGLAGADGSVLLAAKYSNIGKFQYGYALVFG